MSNDLNHEPSQPIIAVKVNVKPSSKNIRTIEQKLDCLRKVISNSKEHIEAGDPPRIYSQYIRYALNQFDYLNFCASSEASDLKQDCIHEHVVPHAIVMAKLLALDSLTDENIMSILNKFYFICKITKGEDKRLNVAGLKSAMPPEWNSENDSIFARYEHDNVGIFILNN